MPDEQKKILPIDYTNREFNTIRRDLYGIAERCNPDTFRDFSEGSFGAMMVDAVAYVSDQLSFYLAYYYHLVLQLTLKSKMKQQIILLL